MNEFHQKLYGEKSKELFRPVISGAIELAQIYTDKAYKIFSENIYKKHNKSLSVFWLESESFKANASVNMYDNNKHSINISYGIAIDIYKDGSLFYEICTRYFVKEEYSLLRSLFNYPNNGMVLPDNDGTFIKEDNLLPRVLFNNLSITWLYLHEQAHLTQSHGLVFSQKADASSALSMDLNWEDYEISNDADNHESEYNRWIKHAFELSADFEATHLILIHISIMSENKEIKVGYIWYLISGLTCLFHKFYGENREPHLGKANGTHPDPSIRMLKIYNTIIDFFKDPTSEEFFEEGKSSSDYMEAIEHAFAFANLYIKYAHSNNSEIPEFMIRFDDEDDTYQTYMDNIKVVWNVLRPSVVENYFGKGIPLIMP